MKSVENSQTSFLASFLIKPSSMFLMPNVWHRITKCVPDQEKKGISDNKRDKYNWRHKKHQRKLSGIFIKKVSPKTNELSQAWLVLTPPLRSTEVSVRPAAARPWWEGMWPWMPPDHSRKWSQDRPAGLVVQQEQKRQGKWLTWGLKGMVVSAGPWGGWEGRDGLAYPKGLLQCSGHDKAKCLTLLLSAKSV